MNVNSRKRIGWHNAAILSVLLLAAFLSVHQLGRESLWADELATWARTAQPSLAASVSEGAVDSMWPLYHGGLYLFARLAGDTEFALRFPSALAGVAAVAALYGLGKYLFSPGVGLAGAALMSLSLTQVSYSQEARVYAVEMLVMILAAWTWLRLLAAVLNERGSVLKSALWYALAAAAVIYLHIMGLLILAMQGVAALIVCGLRRRGFRLMAGLYAGLALASLPILLTIPGVMAVKNEFITQPGGLFETLAAHFSYAFSNDALLAGVLALIGVVGAGWALLRRSPGESGERRAAVSPVWMLIRWYAAPFLILYGLSFALRPVLYERYLLMAQPPIYLLAGLAITRLPVRRAIQAGVVIAAMAVLLTDLVGSQAYYARFQKPDYRGMVAYSLTAAADAGHVLVVGIPWPIPIVYRYYLRDEGPLAQKLTVSGAWTQGMMTDALAENKPDRVWVLSATSDRVRVRFLKDQGYQFVETRDFAGNYTMSLYNAPVH